MRKVEKPSGRWAWSYEAIDTKLALSTKPYFLVQLCNYSEHIARLQRSAPEHAAIVLGSGEERQFRIDDFSAYYRRLKETYLAGVAKGDDVYPLKVKHCDLRPWREVCVQRNGMPMTTFRSSPTFAAIRSPSCNRAAFRRSLRWRWPATAQSRTR